jgi:hypothetical protein
MNDERITLGQARRWRDENEQLRAREAALEREVELLRRQVESIHRVAEALAAAKREEPEPATFSRVSALIVLLLGGGLGLHRFYVGDGLRGAVLLLSFAAALLADGLWLLFFDKRGRW